VLFAVCESPFDIKNINFTVPALALVFFLNTSSILGQIFRNAALTQIKVFGECQNRQMFAYINLFGYRVFLKPNKQ